MRRWVFSGLFAALLAVALAGGALADRPSPDDPAGKVFGVVPVHGQANKGALSGGSLSYHNGPVMHTNAVYAIYWVPAGLTVSSGYQSVLDGFFQNVAADSGKTSNVYYSDTQYYDNTAAGKIQYSSTFKGFVVDTNPFPPNGCTDSYTSVCLTDAQLQTEINNVIAANGWPRGTGSMFFLFTPKNVGSCYGSACAFSYFCAYHSSFGSGSSATLYANMPYAAWVPSACGSGQSPNGDDADSTINVASHEHNEAITDPLGSAWYDRRGYENGDKCAWNFGSSLGSTNYGKYNQAIGTGFYYLQQEWSNKSSGCVLTGL